MLSKNSKKCRKKRATLCSPLPNFFMPYFFFGFRPHRPSKNISAQRNPSRLTRHFPPALRTVNPAAGTPGRKREQCFPFIDIDSRIAIFTNVRICSRNPCPKYHKPCHYQNKPDVKKEFPSHQSINGQQNSGYRQCNRPGKHQLILIHPNLISNLCKKLPQDYYINFNGKCQV